MGAIFHDWVEGRGALVALLGLLGFWIVSGLVLINWPGAN